MSPWLGFSLGIVDDVSGPRAARRVARVLVPGQQVRACGGAHQVQAPVAVDVDGPDHAGLSDVRVDDRLAPLAAAPVEVGEAVALFPAGGHHLELAVAVEVRHLDIVCARQSSLAYVVVRPRLGQPGISVELEPEDAAANVVDVHDLGLAVAVDVGDRMPLQPLPRPPMYDVLSEVARAVVLVPVQPDARVRADQVQRPVPRQVDGRHADGVLIPVSYQPLIEFHKLVHGKPSVRGGEADARARLARASPR